MSVNQDFGPRIRSWLHERLTERPNPYPILDEVLSQLPTTPQRRHRWWPFDRSTRPPVPAANGTTSSRRFTLFSALKFVAAAVIVALFGGFLLSAVLTTPQREVAPGAVTESPSPMATEESSAGMDAFPTGIFISVDTGRELWEFHGDGTGLARDPVLPGGSFTYAVDGDVYTQVAPNRALNPAERTDDETGTYHWDYDGERLTFELIEDSRDGRVSSLAKTFRPIDDPRVVMVATSDLDVGDPIRAWQTFIDATETGPDAYISKAEYVGHVAAVPISKGQPITPDLLKLRPSE